MFNASGILPSSPSVFGDDFLASEYLLSRNNDTVTLTNNSIANFKDRDQTKSVSEDDNLPEASIFTNPFPHFHCPAIF